MNKKQYKVKIEHGKIIPLEPIDLENVKEGMIVFLEPFEEGIKKNDEIERKIKAIDSVSGMLNDLTEEERTTFEDAIKRRPFFKDSRA